MFEAKGPAAPSVPQLLKFATFIDRRAPEGWAFIPAHVRPSDNFTEQPSPKLR